MTRRASRCQEVFFASLALHCIAALYIRLRTSVPFGPGTIPLSEFSCGP